MEKLLNAYIANPCTANALRVKVYEMKHPMAVCVLTPVQHGWLRQAQTQAS